MLAKVRMPRGRIGIFQLGIQIIVLGSKRALKAMDDIGVVMTPFGDVVTVILVVNSYEIETQGVDHVD